MSSPGVMPPDDQKGTAQVRGTRASVAGEAQPEPGEESQPESPQEQEQ